MQWRRIKSSFPKISTACSIIFISLIPVERIIGLLKEKQIDYQLYEHPPVYTSEQAAEARETKIEQGAKALVMKADKKPILVVLSAAKKLDNSKFKKQFGFKDLAMAKAEEVKEISGVEIGAVPPFGGLMSVETFADKSLAENSEIVFNAGMHTKSIKMKYKDWVNLAKPKTGEFSK